jgi:hypothetical protein
MKPLTLELRRVALGEKPPIRHFWALPWHIQDALMDAKSLDEHWGALRPDERRMFLMFIACAIEGGDL